MTRLLILLSLCIFVYTSCSTANSSETSTQESPAMESETTEETKLLRHVVLFKFKESATEADIASVVEAFEALPAKIPEIKGFEWGTNNSPEGLDKGFTHCFFLSFDSEAGREIYLPHPDHKAFGEVLGPHLDDVLVIDYWQ